MLEALPKFHRQMQSMTSLYPISTTNIHSSSGYAGGAAQIPQANAINDKSCPNSTWNIHSSSGYAGGAAQISQANDINEKSHPNSTTHITIRQVTLEALPKFHRQMQLMTCLIQIRPQTSTVLQVMPEVLPEFHRQMQLTA
jgi:hypothetical protein